MKPLSEMLREYKSKNIAHSQLNYEYVDRASYEKLRQVAIELAKHVEELKNYATMHTCPDNEIAHALLVEVPFYAAGVLSSAKDIIGGKDA